MHVKSHSQFHLVKKFSHDWKDLITRNVHAKYESSTCNGSKVMSEVKILRNVSQRSWPQGHRPWFHLNGFH